MVFSHLRPVSCLLRRDKLPNTFASVLKRTNLQVRNVTTEALITHGKRPPHSLLPTPMLLRSLLITTVSTNRLLLAPALRLLSVLSKSREGFFNVERNPVLRNLLKWTLYNHFCAGENAREVTSTISRIKDMGFKGVILTYAAEVVTDKTRETEVDTGVILTNANCSSVIQNDPAIKTWRNGVLHTLSMIGTGDYLALKFTGAGSAVAKSLESRQAIPSQMQKALEDICEDALKRNASILIDAEQQFVQAGIDRIALDLMRKYNRGQNAVVYNTYQAYLKKTPDILLNHLCQSQKEGFTIGVKLVRGAYINSEPRGLINDTKEQTDNAYNFIAKSILQKQYPTSKEFVQSFPQVQLFLATHNRESVLMAYRLQQEQATQGLPLVKVQYGQLLGMADEVSCTLLQLKDKAQDAGDSVSLVPEAYKCLSWGTLKECLSYLHRRAVENRDAVTRTEEEHSELKKEALRRLLGRN